MAAALPERAIASLFPAGVVSVWATREMFAAPLQPLQEACLRVGACSPRRREFAAGRACAREALRRLGIANFPLLQAADGAPVWPEGVVGSIAHAAGLCGVAIARRRDVASLGFDIEEAGPLPTELLDLVCAPPEREALSRVPAEERLRIGKLLFSIKEAVYKCYAPLARTFLEFHDRVVELDRDAQTFVACLATTDAPSAAGARRFEGRYRIERAHVLAGALIGAR